jgi:hypothetical protein
MIVVILGNMTRAMYLLGFERIGVALVAGKHHGLGTMANIGGDHWVAITLDFEHSAVCYGDQCSIGGHSTILVLNLSTRHSRFPLRRMDICAVCLAALSVY